MKKFIFDQIFTAIIAVSAMIVTPFVFGIEAAIICEVLILVSYGYLCRRLFFLLLDKLCGRKTVIVYFAKQIGIEEYEFFNRACNLKWKFYYGDNQTLILFVPVFTSHGETKVFQQPTNGQKIEISFYPFSKILYSWKPVQLSHNDLRRRYFLHNDAGIVTTAVHDLNVARGKASVIGSVVGGVGSIAKNYIKGMIYS